MNLIKLYASSLGFICLICMAFTCGKGNQGHGDDRLMTINNSPDSIISFIAFNFPDTSLKEEGKCIGCLLEIPPYASARHLNSVNWESDIKRRNSHNTLTVFIVSSDTWRKYSFQQIQASYSILKRYDLPLDSLKKSNWKVTFP
jgi:hypothetical protein